MADMAGMSMNLSIYLKTNTFGRHFKKKKRKKKKAWKKEKKKERKERPISQRQSQNDVDDRP